MAATSTWNLMLSGVKECQRERKGFDGILDRAKRVRKASAGSSHSTRRSTIDRAAKRPKKERFVL